MYVLSVIINFKITNALYKCVVNNVITNKKISFSIKDQCTVSFCKQIII